MSPAGISNCIPHNTVGWNYLSLPEIPASAFCGMQLFIIACDTCPWHQSHHVMKQKEKTHKTHAVKIETWLPQTFDVKTSFMVHVVSLLLPLTLLSLLAHNILTEQTTSVVGTKTLPHTHRPGTWKVISDCNAGKWFRVAQPLSEDRYRGRSAIMDWYYS